VIFIRQISDSGVCNQGLLFGGAQYLTDASKEVGLDVTAEET
jgi:hypothetical protein